jgi:hypothetical protein
LDEGEKESCDGRGLLEVTWLPCKAEDEGFIITEPKILFIPPFNWPLGMKKRVFCYTNTGGKTRAEWHK